MSTLRGLRLINSIENGTVLGTELNTILEDAGRLAEFTVILAQRGQTKRIANAQTSMDSIIGSLRASNAVFLQATSSNDTAVAAIVKSVIAMSTVSNSASTLTLISDNKVSWAYFADSTYYESNIKKVIANLSGINPDLYNNVSELILDPVSMGDISVSARGMKALVSSTTAVYVMASDSVPMALVAANTVAITLVAKQTNIMPIIASYPTAMYEVVSREIATSIMANNVGAIKAIAANETGWGIYLSGPYFSSYLKVILANLAGKNPIDYSSVNSLIDDASALTAISNNVSAVQALMASSSGMSYLAGSSNIGIILSSSLAMGLIGPNTAAMNSFLNASGAWDGLFSSSVAKGYIMASTALVDNISGNAALITYLKTISVTKSATGIPDGNATSQQPFPGLPIKVLTLDAKEVGIAATYSNYNFAGTPMSGSQAGATLSLSGTGTGGQPQHVAAYTYMTWNFQGVGVTAATLPIITYVDMT
jgi:hypothetical protein